MLTTLVFLWNDSAGSVFDDFYSRDVAHRKRAGAGQKRQTYAGVTVFPNLHFTGNYDMAKGRPKRQSSIADLQRQLTEQRQRRTKLLSERKKLEKKMEKIDRDISMLDGEGGSAPSTRSRPQNDMTLPEAMANVMKKGKAMGVTEIADAVKDSGYQSNSANFRGIVNQTLIKDKQFVSESRGMYKLKG